MTAAMASQRHGRRRIWLVLALALWAASAQATTYLERTPDAMLSSAGLVFVGTVASVQVEQEGDTPWTHVRFTVETALEGVAAPSADGSPRSVELSFLGGTIPGGASLVVGGMPAFQVGERVLVFAYKQHYASPIVGFRQALWRVGPAGLRDDDGQLLTVTSDGTLERGGKGSSLDVIVSAIRTRLGQGTATP